MIVEFPAGTDWEEIKHVLGLLEKEYNISLRDFSHWKREDESYAAFECNKKSVVKK